MGDANMCRGWKAVALVAACWCLNSPIHAQGTYPSPVGAARMPEPIPCTPPQGPPPPQPNLIPGPVGPQAAPMGPPDCLTLPYDHSSAFQCENYVQDCGFFLNLGPMAMQRQKLGAGDIAVFNAAAQGQQPPFVGSAEPNPFLPPPPGTASALNFNSFTPAMSLGLRGTVGYLWGGQSIEFTNFYIFQNDVTTKVSLFNGLDTLFFNPPLNFADGNLFRRANQVSSIFGSTLFSSELNYRRWNTAFQGLDLLIGVRYINQNDNLQIVMQGNAPPQQFASIPVAASNVAIYSSRTFNNIVAPQIGMEYTLPVWRWFSISAEGKGAWGANFLSTDVGLARGDGLQGFNTHRSDTNFGQIYQLAGFTDVQILERLRLRLGFQATWLCGVATANDQVDFNLMGFQARQAFLTANPNILNQPLTPQTFQMISNTQNAIPHGHNSNNGSILYWGPLIELQFFF
jgi:hypothetical protein